MTGDGSSKEDGFEGKLVAILNAGALNLALGIGYRLGIFDAMDAAGAPETADDIAARCGLSVRYLREWLGAVCAGGIVAVARGNHGDDRFLLPKAHADLLCRRAKNANLGVYMQEIPLLTAGAMEAVVAGFRTGDGVPAHCYPAFQAFMGELADAKHRRVLVETFLPAVDDGRLVARLKAGIQVCDLGCGQGTAAVLMAAAFPASTFVGMDISAEAVAAAKQAALDAGTANVSFHCCDAADPATAAAHPEAFDYVTAFDAIHDQQRPDQALAGVLAILRPGGMFSMVDIAASSRMVDNLDHPMAAFLYTVSLMHCMPVGLADGGAGLGMMWGRETAVAMLAAAGFEKIAVDPIPEDPFNLHFCCRKPGAPPEVS
jgi:2-polyprenyl-3-methyl-5-hydroxy-6-metoxy-1,4-benzoquinol methylase